MKIDIKKVFPVLGRMCDTNPRKDSLHLLRVYLPVISTNKYYVVLVCRCGILVPRFRIYFFYIRISLNDLEANLIKYQILVLINVTLQIF